jgi:hypothetical protein
MYSISLGKIDPSTIRSTLSAAVHLEIHQVAVSVSRFSRNSGERKFPFDLRSRSAALNIVERVDEEHFFKLSRLTEETVIKIKVHQPPNRQSIYFTSPESGMDERKKTSDSKGSR